MQKLAAKLTEKLLRRRLISPEQSEWCAYLVECKLEQLLCFSVLITLGCLIAPLWKVLLLNWGVVFLRRKANGLHLHTFLGCMLSSLCCELAALWTCEKATPAVAALLLILSLLMLRLAAPVNDINIHFDSNEIQYDSDGKPTLCADCRDLPARLDKALWSVRQAAILTSGTLSAGGNFTHTVQRIGLNNPQTFRAESPFDYKRNCILYFPKRTSTPLDEVEWLSQEIEQLVQVCHGHALVLFTSYDQMGRVQQRLQGRVAYPLLTARRNGQLFVQAFKQLSNAVLFAAGPCWEGVDFPGDRVSLLIIIRLPFPVPDPVSDAEKAKYPDLHSYIQAEVIPTMQKKLRQGFGRAIRTETDTCTVAILDPRAAPGGRYHRAALDALPKMNMTQDIKDVEHFIRAVKGAEYFFD